MSAIEELRAKAAAAKAAAAAVALTDEEAETARLVAEIADSEAEAQAAGRARRAIEGAKREAEAKAKAGTSYLVQYLDLGTLLPEADPSMLPGLGVLVIRSPPAAALAYFNREIEAKIKPQHEVYADLVCASVVYPDVNDPATGAAFRGFFESSIGLGTSTIVGDAVTRLGGMKIQQTKRGRA